MDLLKAVALPAGAVRSEPVHSGLVADGTDERSTNLVMTWLNEYGFFLALAQGSLAELNYFWFMLRRSGVAKYRVSEQEDLGEHVCCLRFVNELFIPKRTVSEELSNASYHLYYTSQL